jgi:hypothetical protein
MKKPNPIAACVQPVAGQQLPAEWRKNTQNAGGTFDRRDLENMWKSPNWSAKLSADNVMRDARLSTWKETLGEK